MTPGSFVRLGYYFVKRVLVRLLGQRGGLRLFEANYVSGDQLVALSPGERAVLPEFSRCIACGACDVQFATQAKITRAFPGPSALPLAFSRNLPDLVSLRGYVDALRGSDLEALERLCPTRVPFRRLVAFVDAQSELAAPTTAVRSGLGPR